MANHAHDLVEILMMAIALGMDAFSLSIGIGMSGLNRRKAFELSVLIGVFHVVMTLLGLSAGQMLGMALGRLAKWFGAFLLIGLGLHMAYGSLFMDEERIQVGTSLIGMVLFSAGVSIDALSVGFSLGLRTAAYGLVSAFAFGVIGAAMCALGLVIGKHVNRWAGVYGELIGALILIGFGVHFVAM